MIRLVVRGELSTEAPCWARNFELLALKKQKVPVGPKSNRDKLGGGRSPHALSRCNRWAPAVQVGRSPTPFSVTRGVVGLIAGPSKALRHMDYWVRFICPLSQWLRPLTCGPGLDVDVNYSPPSHLSMGRPPFLTVRWPVPRVSPLTPQVTIRSLGSAAFFASPPGRIVFTAVVLGSWLSRREPRLLFSFQRISSGWPFPANLRLPPC